MALSLDQIVEEARHLPVEQKAELVDRLAADLQSTPELEAAWREEVRRRVQQIDRGEVMGIPGETVAARIRQIVGQ